jgi:hypothetical protein
MDVWLVVSTPLKNMSSSVGMIISNIWKNKIHVPNHQPDVIFASQPFSLGVFGSFKRLSKVQPVKSHHLIPGFSWPILEHQNS